MLLHTSFSEVVACMTDAVQHAADPGGNVQAKGQSSVWVQQVAVRFMGNWAEASVINCGKIATMQGGQALTEIAAAAASAGHNRQLEYELVRTMALLARDCPLTHSLGIDTWLQQLLYIAADAAAMQHLKLASQVGLYPLSVLTSHMKPDTLLYQSVSSLT